MRKGCVDDEKEDDDEEEEEEEEDIMCLFVCLFCFIILIIFFSLLVFASENLTLCFLVFFPPYIQYAYKDSCLYNYKKKSSLE